VKKGHDKPVVTTQGGLGGIGKTEQLCGYPMKHWLTTRNDKAKDKVGTEAPHKTPAFNAKMIVEEVNEGCQGKP
jgi:hypothetical protein